MLQNPKRETGLEPATLSLEGFIQDDAGGAYVAVNATGEAIQPAEATATATDPRHGRHVASTSASTTDAGFPTPTGCRGTTRTRPPNGRRYSRWRADELADEEFTPRPILSREARVALGGTSTPGGRGYVPTTQQLLHLKSLGLTKDGARYAYLKTLADHGAMTARQISETLGIQHGNVVRTEIGTLKDQGRIEIIDSGLAGHVYALSEDVDDRERVWRCISQHPRIHSRTISQYTGVDTATIGGILSAMVQAGDVAKDGSIRVSSNHRMPLYVAIQPEQAMGVAA